MRLPNINKQNVYYALYASKSDVLDDDGLPTGQYSVSYSDPVQSRMNVCFEKNSSSQNGYGIHDGATAQLSTGNRSVYFDTKTVWWIGVDPDEHAHNYETVSVVKSKSACIIRVKEVSVNEN